MNAGTFAEPGWASLLWLVAAFAVIAFYLERRRASGLSALIASALQDRLVRRPSHAQRMLRLTLFLLSAVALTIALMRPQWGMHLISTPRAGAEIMICLDVSRSMLAEDVTPNRLERAKAELRDLLPYLDGDQVGLIAFAGRASVLSPLTPDFGFLRLVIDDAGPHSVVRGGTRLEEPIRKALAGFGKAGEVARSILLITDGEDHDSFPLEAAKEAAARGIKILAIGFGDEAGSQVLVSDPRTGAKRPLRDADGNIVKSRLDGEILRKLALATAGAYIPAGTGLLDLESIYQRHIAPLTRSSGGHHARSVKGEAFQAFVLLGLLLLIAAVATGAVGSATAPAPRRDRLGSRNAAAVRITALCLLAVLAAATLARAQEGTGDQQEDAAELSTESGEQTAPVEESKLPETPRETFNRGLEDMQAGQIEAADDALRDARRRAATDAELRWRATYDLGWNEAKRADAALETEPAKALEALRRAADWFREAVDLRPGADDARHNLEIVLRRASELADSLASRDEKKLLDAIEGLMDEQRKLTAEVRNAMQQQLGEQKQRSSEASRSSFRALAAEQLALTAKAGELAGRAGNERDAIEQTPEEERKPSQRVRAAQLGGVLAYLHRARERMGYARSQLRKMQGERAFRRSAAALSELGRARDQLLDPVAVLGGILADALDLARLTGRRAALDSGAADASGTDSKGPSATASAASATAKTTPEERWLTDDYLAENQETLRDRTDEIYRRFEAGLQNSESQELSPEQQGLFERIGEASPLLATAIDRMDAALTQLKDGRAGSAVDPQFKAVRALASARERFLDLRRLIELLYRDQLQASRILATDEQRTLEELAEYVPVVVELEQNNAERTTRVARSIAEEMRRLESSADAAQGEQSSNGAAQPQADPQATAQEKARLELAARILAPVPDDLGGALEALEAISDSDQPSGQAFESAREPVQAALEKIEELRRLFFSIIDHLKDLARRQLSLGDRTEEVAAIAKANPDEDHSEQAGPLGPRQQSLASTAEQLAGALREQAAQPPKAAAEGADPQQAEQQAAELADRLNQAAGHVASAHSAMLSAGSNLQINPAPFEDVRKDQDLALEELAAAIALFEQPQQQQQEQQEQQEQERGQQQKEQQAGGDHSDEQQAANTDPAQLMQGIRDREAQRRQQRAKAEQRGYDAVEKDW